MKSTKKRIEVFSFFDHTGISGHLEKMAAKGWMIERIANFGWVYWRIEPKTIHFTVSYFPKASEFDPEPTEEQRLFHDFCAHTGWKLACTSAQLQIFYNEQENPTPIETEPELELQAIHASAKKSLIPSYIMMLVAVSLGIAMSVSNLLGDPIGLLTSSSRMFTGVCYLLSLMLYLVELTCYFRWYSKAKAAAQHGEFLRSTSTAKFQKAILVFVGIGFLYWLITPIVYGNTLMRWVSLLMVMYMVALLGIVNSVKNFLKQKKAPRGVNRTVTMLTSFVVAFAMMGLITHGTIYASSHGLFADQGEETYEHGGMTWVIHNDKLPLTVEDLLDVEYDGYIKERSESISLFLGQLELSQYPRYDSEDYREMPRLEYTITIVNAPFLYDWCRDTLIEEDKERHLDYYLYENEDAAPWGAKEAYRRVDPEFGMGNYYILCYEDRIVEIDFDWEPSDEHKTIVGEKLGNK